MPDITMCTNKECHLSFSCWRFNCQPNEYYQSYSKFEPTVDEVLDNVECKMFLEMPTQPTKRLALQCMGIDARQGEITNAAK